MKKYKPAIDRDTQAIALFACCIPVQGARRSLICDLQRQRFRLIPNGLYQILVDHQGETIAEIKAAYGNEYDKEIDEYVDFLIEHELAFFCDDPDSFPPLDLSWERPERISNAIVDIDNQSAHDYDRIFRELDDLGCKAVELRFFCAVALAEVERVLRGTEGGRLRSIELLLGWSSDSTPDALEGLVRRNSRIQRVVIHSSPQQMECRLRGGIDLLYRREAVDSPACCGQVHSGYFVTNIGTFTEAQQYNTCLNRKISIDARGEIKNCPSLARSFGNANRTALRDAIADKDFSQLWGINKDQIEVCKDCEFRYICTDCRAYLKDPSDLYSKPAKCSYNPYTATWSGSS